MSPACTQRWEEKTALFFSSNTKQSMEIISLWCHRGHRHITDPFPHVDNSSLSLVFYFVFFCKHERHNKAYLQEAGNRGLTILLTGDLLVDQITCGCSSRVQDDSKELRVCVQIRTFNLQYNGKTEMQSRCRLCVFSVEMAGPQCHQQPAQVLLPKTSRTFVYKW